ncbi:hypothetical protein [Streptomyces nigra]
MTYVYAVAAHDRFDFMNGVHTSVLVAGTLCVVGALVAVAGVRGTPVADRP